MKRNLEAILKNTVPNNQCLEWTKCFNTDGYPRANIDGNVNTKVHRVVWELHNKEDPVGKVIRHTCDNIKCVNPEHLLIGTPQDNVKDRDLRNRTYRKITRKIIAWTKAFLSETDMRQKEIAHLLDIDPRRVSDINCGLYSDDGSFKPRSKP